MNTRLLSFFWRSMLCFLVVSNVYAADFYWKATNWGDTQFSNPQAACEAFRQRAVLFGGNWIVGTSVTVTKVSETQFQCFVTTGSGSPTWGVPATGYANRFGDSCPNGGIYNSATGACDLPPCVAKAGTSTPFSKSGTAPDSYMWISADGKMSAPDTAGCFDGCVVSTADQDCTTKISGQYFCRGTAWYDGQQCGTGGDAPDEVSTSSTADYPSPQTTSSETPCVMQTNPDGTQSCTSSTSTESEGQNCGTVNGVKRCFDKPPAKDATSTNTTSSTTTNADGSSTTTKTDTTTQTKCNGVNACTSSTSTVTTTTTKDASGNVTGKSSSCTGANCATNTNPDGNGDGLGDCVGDKCADSSGGAVEGQSCTAELVCSGDAVQCAILRQEKLSQCADQEWRDYSKAEPIIAAEIAKSEYQLAAESVDASTFFNTGTRFLPSTCPADKVFSVQGRSFALSYAPICYFASALSYIVVAMASLFFMVYVGRSFGSD